MRPDTVVMRGSASTRAVPLRTSRFNWTGSESGVRVIGCRWPIRSVLPLASVGTTSLKMLEMTGCGNDRPRSLATVSSISRICVSSTTSFCATSSCPIRSRAIAMLAGLPVRISCCDVAETVMCRSGADAPSACVTVAATSLAVVDGLPLSPGSAARSV